jgi:hypothetical protein
MKKRYSEHVDHDIHAIKRLLEFCIFLLIVLTALWFFGGHFLERAPEPAFWIAFRAWLFNLI